MLVRDRLMIFCMEVIIGDRILNLRSTAAEMNIARSIDIKTPIR